MRDPLCLSRHLFKHILPLKLTRMALIEGVGDEVTVLFGLVLLFLVLMLAWASTHTADRSEQLTSNRSASGESSLDSNFAETASVSTEAQDVKEVGKTPQSEDEDKNERPTEVDAASVDENEQHQEIGTENSQTASVHTSTDQPQSSSANNESLEDDSVLSRNMVLRLKFLNDTERVAQVKPGDTIGYIKRYSAPLIVIIKVRTFYCLDVKSSKLYTVWHKISACLKT
uniref:Uncharacterized protein n=1 Tax=Erpetoichthys calabaricus TaxID=27687 RepID=A0A8C4TNI6_ERPCA